MTAEMWRADAARSGSSPGLAPTVAPELRWSWVGPRNQQAAPITAGSRVIVGGRDGLLRSLRADSGAPEWEVHVGGAIGAAIASADGRIYTGCEGGSVSCVDAASGSVRWRAEIGVPIGSAPLLADDRVIVAVGGTRPGMAGGGVAALALQDGRLEWFHETEAGCLASAAYADGAVAYASRNGELGCVNVTDGRPQWRAEGGGDRTGTPAIHAGTVVSDSGAGSVEAHRLRDGQLVWSFGLARSAPMSSAALGTGAAFIGGGDGHLYALDVATGRPRWTVDRMGDQGWESFASPTVVGDTVIVGCSDG
ncbi:MAG TPA: PQQ-binding-like beta-propeller repeat protein, partial [Egibacteraceae bacterium]|nr:PQQ-binding-like beta-propeller repeat protein [Egibacteraceae bacterium]